MRYTLGTLLWLCVRSALFDSTPAVATAILDRKGPTLRVSYRAIGHERCPPCLHVGPVCRRVVGHYHSPSPHARNGVRKVVGDGRVRVAPVDEPYVARRRLAVSYSRRVGGDGEGGVALAQCHPRGAGEVMAELGLDDGLCTSRVGRGGVNGDRCGTNHNA